MVYNKIRSIAVVDDNFIELKLIERVIESHYPSIRLYKFQDEHKFLDNIYDYNNVDLIILDINMPYISGLEILQQLRQNKINTPIIIMSTSDELSDVCNAYEYGANSYITKPVDYEVFKYKIKIMIEYWFMINFPYPNSKLKQNKKNR